MRRGNAARRYLSLCKVSWGSAAGRGRPCGGCCYWKGAVMYLSPYMTVCWTAPSWFSSVILVSPKDCTVSISLCISSRGLHGTEAGVWAIAVALKHNYQLSPIFRSEPKQVLNLGQMTKKKLFRCIYSHDDWFFPGFEISLCLNLSAVQINWIWFVVLASLIPWIILWSVNCFQKDAIFNRK